MTSINKWLKQEQPELALVRDLEFGDANLPIGELDQPVPWSVPEIELHNLRPVKNGPFAVVVGDDEFVYFASAFAASTYAGQIGEPVAFEFVGAIDVTPETLPHDADFDLDEFPAWWLDEVA